ncbi:hypothetical protein [Pedococcus bigeumensis]|nr:hypothetical protein [Pedococcus bigeumensis]
MPGVIFAESASNQQLSEPGDRFTSAKEQALAAMLFCGESRRRGCVPR